MLRVGIAAGEWISGGSSAGTVSPPAEEYDAQGIILPEAYAQHAKRWIDAGARVVGGCCGVGPAHIAELRCMVDRMQGAEEGGGNGEEGG
jgi:methionine synthase I (cobalamin-dependent)